MNTNQQIDKFIQAMGQVFSTMDTSVLWPLNGGQIDAYFDVEESLDMYSLLNNLRKKHSYKEIAEILPPADVIRLFLENNAIIGLKVAKKLKIKNISVQNRVDYCLLLFNILKEKVQNDIFCLDGKNLLLENKEIKKLLQLKWNMVETDEEKRQISFLAITASNLCYTLYYDLFMAGGFFIHGPYDVTEKFGPKTILVIRDYHDISPTELWPDLKVPCKTIKIFGIYRDLDLKINFMNHPFSFSPVGPKLIAYKIYVDNKEIGLKEVVKLEETLEKIAITQTAKVNSLSNLDKVRKGSEIAYYLFKDFRKALDIDWRPPKEVENIINKFGETFIEKFKQNEKPSIEHWKKLFDPRIDYY